MKASLQKLVVANWKMNLSLNEASALSNEIASTSSKFKNVQGWIAPPTIHIGAISKIITSSSLKLGAQNVFSEAKGAFTGETSAPMLIEYGCSFALVGHSERRHIFNEDDQSVTKRALGALGHGLEVVFCCGETEQERSKGETEVVLTRQLAQFLKSLPDANTNINIVLAYEPVWAIGTGNVATPDKIEQAHRLIKSLASEYTNREFQILYGGSVTPENFKDILSVPLVSGGLIGGASLVASKFIKLLEIAEASQV